MKIKHLEIEVPKIADHATYQTIKNIFKDVSSIGCLVIGGEQPLFDETIIDTIVDEIIAKHIEIEYFISISTPEISLSNRSIMLLQKLYDHCESKERCSVIIKCDNIDHRFFDFDMMIRKKFEFVNNRFKEYESVFDRNNVYCLNGVEIDGDTIKSDIFVSGDGFLYSGHNIYNKAHHSNIGNINEIPMEELLKKYKKMPSELHEIEIVTETDISFSSYWERLSEDKRGDWFGYVFTKMFDRNFPGYGLFQVVKDNPELSKLDGFEEIVSILNLESNIPPPWLSKNELKREEQVKMEFFGYAQILRDEMYRRSPILEIVDIYYKDLPYKASLRLKHFIDKFVSSSYNKKEEINA